MEVDQVVVYLLPTARLASIRRGRIQPCLRLRLRCSCDVIVVVRIVLPYLAVASLGNALRLLQQVFCFSTFQLESALFLFEALLAIFLFTSHFRIGDLLLFAELLHFL